jgi:hypothetical protein
MGKGFPNRQVGLTYAQEPVLGDTFPAFSKAFHLNLYLIVFYEYLIDEFVCKERKSLFLRGVKDIRKGFPTKLSTDFVDKIIAL